MPYLNGIKNSHTCNRNRKQIELLAAHVKHECLLKKCEQEVEHEEQIKPVENEKHYKKEITYHKKLFSR